MKSSALRLAGIDTGRPLLGPQTIHIDVTNACNADCITCWDHSPLLAAPRPAAWKRQRVEVSAVEALLDDTGTLGGLEAVILSGMGDPFVHPRIYDLIAAVKTRRLHCTLITNLIPADAARVIALNVDELLIGIHGASEKSYRAFHPNFIRDEWQRLHEMLAAFHSAGRRYKHVHVICKPNAGELVEMVRLGSRFAAKAVNFKLASLKDGTEACRITAAQRALLRNELVPEALREAAALGVTTNLDVFASQLSAGGAATAPIADIGCFMGFAYSRIAVDGTVLFCCNTEVVVGKLDEHTRFSDLWNGSSWNALRDRLRAGDYLDSCAQCGKVNQNVKLGSRFAERYGEERLRAVTGRA